MFELSNKDFKQITRNRLADYCRDHGIKGYSGKTKQERINLIKRHYKANPKYWESKKSKVLPKGYSNPYLSLPKGEMTKKQKLLYNLSLAISGMDDEDAGDPEPYLDSQPKLKKALREFIKNGGLNTKDINEGLKVYKKYNLGSDTLWDISLDADEGEYKMIKESYGISSSEADALMDLANGVSWFDNYDKLC